MFSGEWAEDGDCWITGELEVGGLEAGSKV